MSAMGRERSKASRHFPDIGPKAPTAALHSWSEVPNRAYPLRQAPYKSRNCIEIMFGRLKDWRRVATRFDRCPTVFQSAIALAATVLFLL